MSRARRPGVRWRLLVHELPDGGNGMSGTAHHVGSEAPGIGQDAESATHHHLPRTEFDELVVGFWLHVERMAGRRWWMDVGGVVLWVEVDRDGRPKVVDVHMPPGEKDPVPGCAYEVTGGPSDPGPIVNTEAEQENR